MWYFLNFTCHFVFFNDTATTEIYTLSLHDALPIWFAPKARSGAFRLFPPWRTESLHTDRKSTRLNSSHLGISYAVFCLKKKTKNKIQKYRGETGTSATPIPRDGPWPPRPPASTPAPWMSLSPCRPAASLLFFFLKKPAPPKTPPFPPPPPSPY